MKKNLAKKFWDRFGKEISEIEWREMVWDPKYKILAVNKIKNLKIITSWVGNRSINENFDTVIYNQADECVLQKFHQSETLANKFHREISEKITNDNLDFKKGENV